MSLTLTEEQVELRSVLRDFFTKRCDEDAVRQHLTSTDGYDATAWKQLNEQIGALSLAVPEDLGGAGFGYLELGIVLEESGRALYSAPLLSTALAIEAVIQSRDTAAMAEYLPRLASGEPATIAFVESPGHWAVTDIETRAEATSDGWILSGRKSHVIAAQQSTVILVSAKTDQSVSVFAVDATAPGLSVTPTPTVDQTRRQAHIAFDRTPARLVGSLSSGSSIVRHTLDAAAIFLAAEQVGGASRALDLAVEYSKTRVQYGRSIGSFQALKHLCADSLAEIETARSAVYDGLRALQDRAPDLSPAAASAKIFCSEVFVSTARNCIQIHGAIGFTWEHSAHLYFKRATSAHVLFGTPAWHRQRLADLLDTFRDRTVSADTSADTPEEAEFRAQARKWLAENLVGEFAEHPSVGSADDGEHWELRLAWEKKLSAAGWLGLTWPAEYGGRGLPLSYEIIFSEESARAGAPYRVGVHGQDLFGPTLLMHGTPAQKKRFLPAILAVEEFWGQGFSEPEAGSDLASLRTRARLEGDEWVIDGQKIWMTLGHHADWMYVLCRTDPQAPRHKGISLLVIPAHQPGVEVRPIRNMAGEADFCEVFFNGARTAADCVIGPVNEGWRVAMSALQVERGSLLMPVQFGFEREIDEALEIARTASVPDSLRDRLIDAWVAVRLMRATNLRTIAEVRQGVTPGSQATTSKLFASVQHQRLLDLAVELLAETGTVAGPDYELHPLVRASLHSRAETIYGGSSQVQRNIISERLLGMPRESQSR